MDDALKWLVAVEEQPQVETDTAEFDNDKKGSEDKLAEDTASEPDTESSVDVEISVETTASIQVLDSTADLPTNPTEGEGYQIGDAYWVFTNGEWVTRDGIYGLEQMVPALHVGKTIEAFGKDEVSGAYNRYVISGFDASTNPAKELNDEQLRLVILLQNGVLPEVGLNGVTIEDLLLVVKDVLTGFQSGQFACQENERALFHVTGAIDNIRARGQRRVAEGTEGTLKP